MEGDQGLRFLAISKDGRLSNQPSTASSMTFVRAATASTGQLLRRVAAEVAGDVSEEALHPDP